MRARVVERIEHAIDICDGDALRTNRERRELALLGCRSRAHRDERGGATLAQRALTILQPSGVRTSWR